MGVIDGFLALPHLGSQIRKQCRRQIRTLLAGREVTLTVHREMADGSGGPDVVHGPHDGFAAFEYLPQHGERQHALIDPVQVDDVGLPEDRQSGDVAAGVGDVEFEEMFLAEMQMGEDAQPFPQEMPPQPPIPLERYYRAVGGLPATYQHTRFNSMKIQGSGESLGGKGSPTCLFTRIDDKYPHARLKGTAL